MATMKIGMVVFKGTLEKMQKEYDELLGKAKEGYGKMVYEFEGDILGTFKIEDTNIQITFSLSKGFNDKFAIYQIME